MSERQTKAKEKQGRAYENPERERRWPALEHWPVRRVWAGDMGWVLHAARDIAAGECVLREWPLSSALFSASASKYCAGCFSRITHQHKRAASKLCKKCSGFRLCPQCKPTPSMREAHAIECELLGPLVAEKAREGTPLDTVYARFFIRLLQCVEYHPVTAEPQSMYIRDRHTEFASEWVGSADTPPAAIGVFEAVADFEEDATAIESHVLEQISHWSRVLYDFAEKADWDLTLAADELESLFKKAVFNWHAIAAAAGDAAADEAQGVGYALYCWACNFNHACDANVAWRIEPGSGQFVATAQRAIAKGEELCISYFGSDAARDTDTRQAYLQLNYHFLCACPRCAGRLDCAVCKKKGALTCGRCGAVKYCSKTCQRQHWQAHKAECRAASARAPAPDPSTSSSSPSPPSTSATGSPTVPASDTQVTPPDNDSPPK